MEPVGPYQAGHELGTHIAVHAGFPNPAAERSGAPLKLDRLLIHHPSSTFLFRVRGHSWHRYGVFDGDLAIIDRAYQATESDLVVWWDESGSFCLSRFQRADQARTWGVVTAVIHPTQRLGALQEA